MPSNAVSLFIRDNSSGESDKSLLTDKRMCDDGDGGGGLRAKQRKFN